MNQSNLYTYYILTITWNDLDCDVLKLVKEYLRVHLNRRLLHDDYNNLLENIKKNTKPSLLGDGPGEGEYMNSIRYGLAQDIYRIEHYYKYFVMGEDLCIDYGYGSNNQTRRHFISYFQFKFNELSESKWDFNIEDISDDTIKMYVRHLMDAEERILLKNTQ